MLFIEVCEPAELSDHLIGFGRQMMRIYEPCVSQNGFK